MRRIKPKLDRNDLKETAEQVIRKLEDEERELLSQISLLHAKVDDIERKIRWLKREILQI